MPHHEATNKIFIVDIKNCLQRKELLLTTTSVASLTKIITDVIKIATVNFLPDEKAEDTTNAFA
ncbi:MAG: hypothetical protein ACTS7E_02770 [Arsenophonus sp. NC-CH8-MAG3]